MSKPQVFLCMPRYSRMVDAMAMQSLQYATRGMCNVDIGPVTVQRQSIGSPCQYEGSLLAFVFNKLWCMALNMRKICGVTHFAMLHADVEAEPGWLDILYSEMQRVGCDFISTVIPLKNETGLTSTGLGDPDIIRGQAGLTGDSRKLTLQEVFKLPSTFSAADTDEPHKVLLPNTGCWLVDITKPWVDAVDEKGHAKFYFTINDAIVFDTEGSAHAETRGEDWNAGYMLHDAGLKVCATRKVRVHHHGWWAYGNVHPWGQETDLSYKAVKAIRKKKAAEAALSS